MALKKIIISAVKANFQCHKALSTWKYGCIWQMRPCGSNTNCQFAYVTFAIWGIAVNTNFLQIWLCGTNIAHIFLSILISKSQFRPKCRFGLVVLSPYYLILLKIVLLLLQHGVLILESTQQPTQLVQFFDLLPCHNPQNQAVTGTIKSGTSHQNVAPKQN